MRALAMLALMGGTMGCAQSDPVSDPGDTTGSSQLDPLADPGGSCNGAEGQGFAEPLVGRNWERTNHLGAAVQLDAELQLEADLDLAGDLDLETQEKAEGRPAALEAPRLAVVAQPPAATPIYRPSAGADRRGSSALLGQPAPELEVAEWTPGDRPPPTLKDNRGRVVVLYAFQGWCPGCQSRGFPVTTKLEQELEGEPVAFIYVQTTFEGFEANDYERAVDEQRRWRIEQPVGHDEPRGHDERPSTMRNFRTGGTPWTVMIDPWGRVRFNDFTRSYEQHRAMIDTLLDEARRFSEPSP